MDTTDARRPRLKGYKARRIDGAFEVTVPTDRHWAPCGHGPFVSVREAIAHATEARYHGPNDPTVTHPRWQVIRTGPDVVIGTPAKRNLSIRGVDAVIMRQHWEPPSTFRWSAQR
jgi:hypothetical protein